jgi:hypothetical protein
MSSETFRTSGGAFVHYDPAPKRPKHKPEPDIRVGDTVRRKSGGRKGEVVRIRTVHHTMSRGEWVPCDPRRVARVRWSPRNKWAGGESHSEVGLAYLVLESRPEEQP